MKIKLARDTIDADGNISSVSSILLLNIRGGDTGSILTEEVKSN
jgi:hypothetical protein